MPVHTIEEAKRLKSLKDENRRLKRMVAGLPMGVERPSSDYALPRRLIGSL